jgi:hypothetical protein
MFGFLGMMDNYEQRKVANTKINETEIDTAMVSDSARPYETGICNPQYNNGNWIIVELYDSKELSKIGHKKWVKLFSDKKLPSHLTDVSECDFIMAVNDGVKPKKHNKKLGK